MLGQLCSIMCSVTMVSVQLFLQCTSLHSEKDVKCEKTVTEMKSLYQWNDQKLAVPRRQ